MSSLPAVGTEGFFIALCELHSHFAWQTLMRDIPSLTLFGAFSPRSSLEVGRKLPGPLIQNHQRVPCNADFLPILRAEIDCECNDRSLSFVICQKILKNTRI